MCASRVVVVSRASTSPQLIDALTCVAVVLCAVLTRLVSQFLGGTRWGSPVAAGAFVSFALMLCISVSGYKHASAVELGLGVGSFVSMGSTNLLPETSDVAAAAALAAGFVLLLLPIQVHPPGGKQGLTAALGCLAWAGVRRLLCRPPEKSPERRALINHR